MNTLTLTDAEGATRHAVGVHILLVDTEGRFLLQLRSRTVALAPGWWSTPCGNLEAENATAGAAREASEELDVQIDPTDLSFAHLVHFQNAEGRGPAFAVFFRTTAWRGTPKINEADKADDQRWVHSPDDLPDGALLVGYVRHALQQIKAGNPYSEYDWPITPVLEER